MIKRVTQQGKSGVLRETSPIARDATRTSKKAGVC